MNAGEIAALFAVPVSEKRVDHPQGVAFPGVP